MISRPLITATRPPVNCWAQHHHLLASYCLTFLTGALFCLVVIRSTAHAPLSYHEIVSQRLDRALFQTERTAELLQRQYYAQCGLEMPLELAHAALGEIIRRPAEDAVQLGHEAWNRISLHETVSQDLYFADAPGAPPPQPLFILSYGKRLDQGRQLMERIAGTAPVDYVSFPSLERAFAQRQHLSRALFRDAARLNWAQYQERFSGKEGGYLLSTLNQWMVLEKLADGTYPEEVFVVEDDVLSVPDFRRKFESVRAQLATIPDWEVVFAGSCLKLTREPSSRNVTANLYEAGTTRCFNAVMLRRSAAVKILRLGAIVDDFVPVDWLFNQLIPKLGLRTFFVEPPLAFEESKLVVEYPC